MEGDKLNPADGSAWSDHVVTVMAESFRNGNLTAVVNKIVSYDPTSAAYLALSVSEKLDENARDVLKRMIGEHIRR